MSTSAQGVYQSTERSNLQVGCRFEYYAIAPLETGSTVYLVIITCLARAFSRRTRGKIDWQGRRRAILVRGCLISLRVQMAGLGPLSNHRFPYKCREPGHAWPPWCEERLLITPLTSVYYPRRFSSSTEVSNDSIRLD